MSILWCFLLLIQGAFAANAQSIKVIDQEKNDSIALQLLEQALSRSRNTQQRLELQLRVAMRANALQQFEKALTTANEALAGAKSAGSDSLEAALNKQIGVTYYYMDQKRSAVPYFDKAATIAEQKGLWELEASCRNNLGAAWADVQEYARSEPELLRSLSIMKVHGMENSPTALRTYRVLARVYSQDGKTDKAEKIYLLLIQLSESGKDSALLSDNLLFYSEILRDRKEHAKSVEMGQRALIIIRKRNDPRMLVGALSMQSLNLSAFGKDREAVELSREAQYLMRTNFTADLASSVAESEVKYRTAQLRYEKDVAELNNRRQRQIYVFSFIGTLLLLGAGAFILNQRRSSRQKAQRQAEMAEADKQRFKEVLGAEENERRRIAQELHDGLGQTLALARLNVSMLQSSDVNEGEEQVRTSLEILDAACNEVRHISHNMMPGALIHMGLIPALNDLVDNVNASNVLRIRFSADKEIKMGQETEVVIYRIIQEILNNTLKHAKASELAVSMVSEPGYVAIRTKDDGIGCDADRISQSPGIGWKNIHSRIALCNGSIEVNSAKGNGMATLIRIPT